MLWSIVHIYICLNASFFAAISAVYYERPIFLFSMWMFLAGLEMVSFKYDLHNEGWEMRRRLRNMQYRIGWEEWENG